MKCRCLPISSYGISIYIDMNLFWFGSIFLIFGFKFYWLLLSESLKTQTNFHFHIYQQLFHINIIFQFIQIHKKLSHNHANKIESSHEMISRKNLKHITSAPSKSPTEVTLQQERQGTEGAHGSEKIERRCCFYHMCVTVCLSSSSAGCLFLGGKRGGRVGVFGLPWEH